MLREMFPYLPHQPGYNKRLRATLPLIKQVIRDLAADSDFWFDTVWIADSTPVECGRSRPAVKRSNMAGWANYGYCASHSRWFWGLRLYLICTPAGIPILWALADPKIGEREVLAAMLDLEPQLAAARPGLTLITGKGFAGRQAEAGLAARARPSGCSSPCCCPLDSDSRTGARLWAALIARGCVDEPTRRLATAAYTNLHNFVVRQLAEALKEHPTAAGTDIAQSTRHLVSVVEGLRWPLLFGAYTEHEALDVLDAELDEVFEGARH